MFFFSLLGPTSVFSVWEKREAAVDFPLFFLPIGAVLGLAG
jgi:hypothetical protein